MIYNSRMAAWKAALILNHIQNMGLTHIQMQQDGSVRFRHNGVPFHADFVQGRFIAQIVTKSIQSQKPVQVEARIGPSPMNEVMAENLTHHNPQHHASDPHGRVRKNAFGDVCQKPMVEGYDDEAYRTVLENRRARQEALDRVRAVEARPQGGLGAARRLTNVRMRYHTGQA